MVKTFIPVYSANPRALTTYGGFQWKTKFEIPAKKPYGCRGKKKEEKPEAKKPSSEWMVMKNFDEEMSELKNILDDIADRVEKIENTLKNTPVVALMPLLR